MTQGGLAILALAIYERGGDKAVDPRGGDVTGPRIREAKVCERVGDARIWWKGSLRDGKAVCDGKGSKGWRASLGGRSDLVARQCASERN